MPDAGQMTVTTCQSCVLTFADKKSYEQKHSTFFIFTQVLIGI